MSDGRRVFEQVKRQERDCLYRRLANSHFNRLDEENRLWSQLKRQQEREYESRVTHYYLARKTVARLKQERIPNCRKNLQKLLDGFSDYIKNSMELEAELEAMERVVWDKEKRKDVQAYNTSRRVEQEQESERTRQQNREENERHNAINAASLGASYRIGGAAADDSRGSRSLGASYRVFGSRADGRAMEEEENDGDEIGTDKEEAAKDERELLQDPQYRGQDLNKYEDDPDYMDYDD